MIEIVLDILMIIGLMGISFWWGKFLGYKILEKQRQRVVRRNVADRGCNNCKHINCVADEEPCNSCLKATRWEGNR
jgi:hypothetical protein